MIRRTIQVLSAAMLLIALREVPLNAQSCSSSAYARYRWEYVPNTVHGVPQCETTGWCTAGCGANAELCPFTVRMWRDLYSCVDDSLLGSYADYGGCPCDAGDVATWLSPRADSSFVPGGDQCGSAGSPGGCQTSTPEPPRCGGTSPGSVPPIDKGCNKDEPKCTGVPQDGDGAPLRFSSGRVESNPIELFRLSTPEDFYFGYRIQWGSHVDRVMAQARCPTGNCNAGQDTVPTIHDQNEVTHYLGRGWQDDYSDRLFVSVKNMTSTTITWQSANGTVTFLNSGGTWKSWSGNYELIDRGANPADGLGRWVVRTTDTNAPRRVWSFEEYTITAYNGASYRLGRLRRHAVLTTNLSDLGGQYGYTVNWTAGGTTGVIANVVDSLGRELDFAYYSPSPNNGITASRSLSTVSYKPAATATAVTVVTLQMTSDNQLLERVEKAGVGGYTRFLYYHDPTGACVQCATLITDIVAPADGATSTPASQAPVMSTELVLEHNDYGSDPFTSSSQHLLIGTHTRYPGHEYAYQYPSSTTTTQFDLHQPCGAGCQAGGPCPAGYALYTDNLCYVADTMQHDSATRLPTSRQSAGTSGASGNANAFTRTYSSSGTPVTHVDAAGVVTSTGYDSNGRVRCIVHNDDDGQAFADPAHPDTSACAGPSTSQVIRVDYSAACTGGYTNCTVKTTASVLSGSVTEETDLDATTLRLVRRKVTGNTHDINGTLMQQVVSETKAYDSYGRISEENGPLDDTVGLDKSTVSYYTSYSSASPFDIGNVYQVTQYVGTATSSVPITTTYSDYDVFGTPHTVTGPNGDKRAYSPSADRLTWTVTQIGSDQATVSTSTVVLNANGKVHSTTDADGICITYEYFDDNNTYVGAPTRIRRSASTDNCGGAIASNMSSGEVELRTYVNAEPERLQSVTRYSNGVAEATYSGFTYDRDRRLVAATTLDSSNPFVFGYTDVIGSSLIAPDAPGPGTWRTDSATDALARRSSVSRYVDGSNKQTFDFGYSNSESPRPTQLTRGYNGSTTSVTTFVYDDFGRLVEAIVPEAGAPGSPAPTRYEYDVAGRVVKQRVGSGTPLARTAVSTYDSLGRLLTVDNDVEHPVDCSSAASGTPIEDVEYRYDSCATPDVPSGFSCTNSLGRLTLARTLVQCGTTADIVKRGRWYDYDSVGRLSRIAYATVSGGTIGAPAIMDYSYTAAGRVSQYRSPLNAAFGTQYSFGANDGRVSQATTSTSGGSTIASQVSYRAFGPITGLVTGSLLTRCVAGSQCRRHETLPLTLSATYRSDDSRSAWSWKFAKAGTTPQAIVDQTYGRTSAGAISNRTDAADAVSSRFYGYDALLRMTCEARGDSNGAPSGSDCSTTSTRIAALLTYGNGENASSPQDVRLTTFLVADDASYASPSVETSNYTSGSSQVQGVARTSDTLVVSHDALGRRQYEYDSFDATRSRRDYTYLPNGQLGTIAGQTDAAASYTGTMRYDERGRPITMAYGGPSPDSYELYWDDADRLVAAEITFPTCRGGNPPPGCEGAYTSVRWHYHYVDGLLVAATRELNGFDAGGAPTTLVKRFWAASDERGLVYRLTDEVGATYWQGRWDASGWLTLIGTPQTEMWMPFALAGQVALGDVNVSPGTTHWGTEAYGSASGVTRTRPSLALNRWRAYDPLLGAFLQPDGNDQVARLQPEGYILARNNPVNAVDSTGAETSWPDDLLQHVEFDASCDQMDRALILNAMLLAYQDVANCHEGHCAGNADSRRGWLNAIVAGGIMACPKTKPDLVDANFRSDGLAVGDRGRITGASTSNDMLHTELDPGVIGNPFVTPQYPNMFSTPECLAAVLAHERLHVATNHGLPYPMSWNDGVQWTPPEVPVPFQTYNENETWVEQSVYPCFGRKCPRIGGLVGPLVPHKL